MHEAPEGHVVSVKAPTRNSEQNARLHARLGEIAATHEWAGKKWPLDVWKRLLTAAWSRATGRHVMILPALDGQGIDAVYVQTSTLSVRECADLMEFIDAWDATGEA